MGWRSSWPPWPLLLLCAGKGGASADRPAGGTARQRKGHGCAGPHVGSAGTGPHGAAPARTRQRRLPAARHAGAREWGGCSTQGHWVWCSRRAGTQDEAMVAPGGRRRRKTTRSWRSSPDTSSEKEKRMGNGQTVMDSIKGIRYGVEKDEIYLVVVVVVDAGTRWFGQKSSPKSSPET